MTSVHVLPHFKPFFQDDRQPPADEASNYSDTLHSMEAPVLQKKWTFYAKDAEVPTCMGGIRRWFGDVFKGGRLSGYKAFDHWDEDIMAIQDYCRRRQAEKLIDAGYVVRRLCVRLRERSYDAVIMGHVTQIKNGRWCIAAMPGQGQDLERGMEEVARRCYRMGYNVLMVNGPESGWSEGRQTWDRLGEAQEAGLQFLEDVVNPRCILLAREAWLGGAAMGKAIQKHEFDKERIHYFALSQQNFAKPSLTHLDLPGPLKWIGIDTKGSIKGSQTLQAEGIHEIVVEATKEVWADGVIQDPSLDSFSDDQALIPAKGTLGHHLVDKEITEKKTFMGHPGMRNEVIRSSEYWENELVYRLLLILHKRKRQSTGDAARLMLEGLVGHLNRWFKELDRDEGKLAERLLFLMNRLLREENFFQAGELDEDELQILVDVAHMYLAKKVVEGLVEADPDSGVEALLPEAMRQCRAIGLEEGEDDSLEKLVWAMLHNEYFQLQLADKVHELDPTLPVLDPHEPD